jgi:hypothetical protein
LNIFTAANQQRNLPYVWAGKCPILELCVRTPLHYPEVVSPVNIEVEQVSSRLLFGGFEVRKQMARMIFNSMVEKSASIPFSGEQVPAMLPVAPSRNS